MYLIDLAEFLRTLAPISSGFEEMASVFFSKFSVSFPRFSVRTSLYLLQLWLSLAAEPWPGGYQEHNG